MTITHQLNEYAEGKSLGVTVHVTDGARTTEASICFWVPAERINVLCVNASSRAWRRPVGRDFDTWEAAASAYKSSAMKAAISHAEEVISERLRVAA